MGEETCTNLVLTDEPTWIIDPIDGTTNYVHRIPIFAINVAFLVNKVIHFGAAFNPAQNELYTARKDKGAFLNGNQIFCTNIKSVRSFRYQRIVSILLLFFCIFLLILR